MPAVLGASFADCKSDKLAIGLLLLLLHRATRKFFVNFDGSMVTAGQAAKLAPPERCVALLAGTGLRGRKFAKALEKMFQRK